MTFVLLAAGLGLLVFGGDLLVRGAVSLASRLGVSPLLIGLTVVGFGTSTPELVTSLNAAFQGTPGIAVGNVIGSNTANILLILGLTVAVAPFAVPAATFRRDAAALLAAAVAAVLVATVGEAGRLAGGMLLLALAVYIGSCALGERGGAEPDALATHRPAWQSALLAFIGVGGTILGAHLFVTGAIRAAEALGLSDAVIGLTVVAVGTSLPELVASLMAALRRQPGLALGNVVGSNIYNVFGILGATALASPFTVPAEIARVDVWVMAAATVLLAVFATSGARLARAEGAVLLSLYIAYTAYLLL